MTSHFGCFALFRILCQRTIIFDSCNDGIHAITFFQLWIVSNCAGTYGANQRIKYSNELIEAGLLLNRYVTCFQNKEDIKKLPQEIVQPYKFYFAFENALHYKDYTTAKFWVNSLSSSMVSVVWGLSKEDVTRLAPTKSFIYAEDFESPSKLAANLLYLDKNDTAYCDHFQWVENHDERTINIVALKIWHYNLCNYISKKERKQS